MEQETIMTRIVTTVTRGSEKAELTVEEPMTQAEFEDLKIEMNRIQFESDFVKELKENAAIVAEKQKQTEGE